MTGILQSSKFRRKSEPIWQIPEISRNKHTDLQIESESCEVSKRDDVVKSDRWRIPITLPCTGSVPARVARPTVIRHIIRPINAVAARDISNSRGISRDLARSRSRPASVTNFAAK